MSWSGWSQERYREIECGEYRGDVVQYSRFQSETYKEVVTG